jgi:S-adenosylmethionine:tRNA ribosyltransferase-isomerase
LKTSDFDYHLPEASIAQTPAEPRDSSRLLVLHHDTGELEHRIFRDVTDYLRVGDLLVLNQTRVIPARIYARKETGGRVEILLLRRRDTLTWEALVGGKGLRVGKMVFVDVGNEEKGDDDNGEKSGNTQTVQAEIVELLEGSERLIRFSEPIEPYFPKVGNVPLPPYIHENWMTPNAIKPSMPKSRVRPPRPRRDCTSRRACWRSYRSKA